MRIVKVNYSNFHRNLTFIYAFGKEKTFIHGFPIKKLSLPPNQFIFSIKF